MRGCNLNSGSLFVQKGPNRDELVANDSKCEPASVSQVDSIAMANVFRLPSTYSSADKHCSRSQKPESYGASEVPN